MFKTILVLCLIVFTNLQSTQKIDLFNEINISSQRAICKKDKLNKSIIIFKYIDDVLVNFSDGSLAKAEKLSIKINIATNPNNSEQIQNLKEITLNKNVFIKRENRNIKADIAKIMPATKICKLSGNVKIEQTKKDKDFPMITKCEEAHLNLVTEKITLIGDKNNPVHTVITLKGLSNLEKNKQNSANKNI